jgi:uncharacterized SAM-binding protein YcdF (DUF218 family)
MTQDQVVLRTPRRRRWMRVAAGLFVIAVVLYAFSPTLLTAVGEQLIHADTPQRADAIIVLAPFLDRLMEAADLYRQGLAPVVILTRMSRDAGEQELIDRQIIESSEERKRRALIALGVRADAIVVLDPVVDSTADEARAFAEWARRHPIRRAIVVTSPLHTGRSRRTFIRAVEKLPIEVLVRPSSRNTFRSDTWWRSRDTLRDGLIEWQKLVYYRLVELPRLVPAEPVSANAS